MHRRQAGAGHPALAGLPGEGGPARGWLVDSTRGIGLPDDRARRLRERAKPLLALTDRTRSVAVPGLACHERREAARALGLDRPLERHLRGHVVVRAHGGDHGPAVAAERRCIRARDRDAAVRLPEVDLLRFDRLPSRGAHERELGGLVRPSVGVPRREGSAVPRGGAGIGDRAAEDLLCLSIDVERRPRRRVRDHHAGRHVLEDLVEPAALRLGELPCLLVALPVRTRDRELLALADLEQRGKPADPRAVRRHLRNGDLDEESLPALAHEAELEALARCTTRHGLGERVLDRVELVDRPVHERGLAPEEVFGGPADHRAERRAHVALAAGVVDRRQPRRETGLGGVQDRLGRRHDVRELAAVRHLSHQPRRASPPAR